MDGTVLHGQLHESVVVYQLNACDDIVLNKPSTFKIIF